MRPVGVVCFLAGVFLAVGCLRLPIGYYTFLRIVVFVAAVCFIVLNRRDGFGWRNVVTALIGILFNPIIMVHLHSKTAWTVIDAVCAVWFVVMALVSKAGNEN